MTPAPRGPKTTKWLFERFLHNLRRFSDDRCCTAINTNPCHPVDLTLSQVGNDIVARRRLGIRVHRCSPSTTMPTPRCSAATDAIGMWSSAPPDS